MGKQKIEENVPESEIEKKDEGCHETGKVQETGKAHEVEESGKFGKSEEDGKSEKLEKLEKSEKLEKLRKLEKSEESDKSEKSQEITVYGKARIDGVAVPTKELENASEDFPIVLVVGEDFIPVKAGDEIKTPYDAVLPMESIQKVGPMIRVIIKVEPMTNVEAI